MVLDLGKDYYHLSGEGLSDLSSKVKAGNMEDVLRVYESEMRVSHCHIRSETTSDRLNGLLGDVICFGFIEPGQERRHGQLDPDPFNPGPKDQSEWFLGRYAFLVYRAHTALARKTAVRPLLVPLVP